MFGKETVLSDKPGGQGVQEDIQGVRGRIVPTSAGNAAGGKLSR